MKAYNKSLYFEAAGGGWEKSLGCNPEHVIIRLTGYCVCVSMSGVGMVKDIEDCIVKKSGVKLSHWRETISFILWAAQGDRALHALNRSTERCLLLC